MAHLIRQGLGKGNRVFVVGVGMTKVRFRNCSGIADFLQRFLSVRKTWETRWFWLSSNGRRERRQGVERRRRTQIQRNSTGCRWIRLRWNSFMHFWHFSKNSTISGDSTCGQRALYQMGLTGIPIFNVNNNCATGSSALFMGYQFIAGGLNDCVLALGFEKMQRGSLSSQVK